MFTPAFNRAHTLPRLYRSLLNQTSKEFVWMVVNDGSTDDTENLIADYISEGSIPIIYHKTENGGKQRAHNFGVSMCDAELFLCVDSDDYLTDDAVETLIAVWEEERDKSRVAGIVFLKGFSKTKPLGPRFPSGVKHSTLRALYDRYHFRGDTGLMYRTDVLKRFPFFVAEGEKFIGESYAYDQIDQHFEMRVLDKILYIAEYLPDGYTKNVRRVTKENPIGYLTLKKQSILFDRTVLAKFRDTILYLVGCDLAKRRGAVLDAPSKVLAIIAYIPSKLVKVIFFR